MLSKVTEGLLNCNAANPTVTQHKNKMKNTSGLGYNNSEGPTTAMQLCPLQQCVGGGIEGIEVVY